MKKTKKILYEVFVLSMPVILGVYLGLLANNWNSERAEKRQTEKVLQNILREINHNNEALEESLEYFKQLRDSIYLLDNRNNPPSNFSFWKGLNPPLLKDAAFQSASISGVLSRFDIDLLEQLTYLYKLQDDLELQTNTYVQSVIGTIGDINFSNNRYLIVLENYAHDQVSSEEALMTEIKKVKPLISNN